MQWSYDLLAEAEQRMFDRLSVFAGRFSRAAALAVGGGRDGGRLSAELAALVDASMVVADVSGRASSYRMLPTLRDFGLSNLRERDELERVRRAHAEYLAADAAEMAPQLSPIGSTSRIEQNVSVEGFRAAADWALAAARTELAVSLFVPLSHHWINSGRLDEAAHWLGRVRQLAVEGSLELWRLELAATMVNRVAGRYGEAKATVHSATSVTLQMGEATASVVALHLAGYIRWRLGDLRGARDDMATVAKAGSDWPGRGRSAREGLAVLELCLGDIAAAEHQADVLVAFADRTKDPVAMCDALNVRGWLACYRGDLEESIRCFEQCRDIAVETGNWHHEVDARLGVGWVSPALDRPDRALAQAAAARDLSINAGNPSRHSESLIVMGSAQLDLADLPGAALSVAEGLEILRDRVRRADHMSRGLRLAGWIALAHGRSDLAVPYMTTAEVELERIHYVDPPADVARAAQALTEAQKMLDETEREALTSATGQAPFAAVLDEAIAYLHELAGGLG